MAGQIGYAMAFGSTCIGGGVVLAYAFMFLMGWR